MARPKPSTRAKAPAVDADSTSAEAAASTTMTTTDGGDDRAKVTVAQALKHLQKHKEATLLLQVMEHFQTQQRKRSKKDKQEEADAFEEQLRLLPRSAWEGFYPAVTHAITTAQQEAATNPTEATATYLELIDGVGQFLELVVEHHASLSVNAEKLAEVVQMLHDQLLRLKGDADQVAAAQEAVALLCEASWKVKLNNSAQTLVTQLLPYLIVRSYESPASGHFNSKRHPIRRLFALKDALLLLDFDDDSSSLLKDILLRCYIQPNVFRSPDATQFLGFLFELHLPFVTDINETIRNQIPNQRKSILKKFGSVYFKAWVNSKGALRQKIEEDCIQRYVKDAVHASSLSLFTATRTVLQIFFDNKRHVGVDEMLYRICSPILWRGVKAANDSVRRQAAILLFDNFPLRDPQFNNEMMDRSLQKQFDAFEELLGDSHPAVRIAAIQGVAKVLSVYWELIPADTIRCFISKLVVDLVNDVSSSAVRTAVFEAVQFILDNYNSHTVLKPLLPMLAPLINDRNERARAEFASLLVRVKSIRNLHFYDIVPVNDLLHRLVLDRDSALVSKHLVSLFLNSYFPQSVGGSSQVARCLALVKKNPEAAMVFYSHVAEHTSVGSVCKLAALLCRCSLNFVSRRVNKSSSDDDNSDDDDNEDDEGFSLTGQIVVLEVMGNLLKGVHKKVMTDERYVECKSFLAEQIDSKSLKALLVAYSEDRPFYADALSSIWRVVGYLGELTEGELLEDLVEQLMGMSETGNKKLLDSMINCLAKWNQLPFLVAKIETYLLEWKERGFATLAPASKGKKAKTNPSASPPFSLNPIVALTAVEYISQAPSVGCSKTLLARLQQVLEACAAPLLEFSCDEVEEACKANAFGLLRLLEIYAKISVVVECASVSEAATAVIERGAKAVTAKEELRSLQPASFFQPPMHLASLFKWITDMLLSLRERTEASTSSATLLKSKKRRRRGKKDTEITKSATSPQNELLTRWRNLFSVCSLLITECMAFSLEATDAATNDTIADFIDSVVSTLAAALDDTEQPERCLFYQSCQLTFVLATVAKRFDQEEAFHERCMQWKTQLQEALAKVHEAHEDKTEDLWKVLEAAPVMMTEQAA
ncbi:TPA: hypothetical protein N0F65_006995 [Lagenidium giganteum]|uniref:Condensin-2 complex subunit G2 n=1 Tax=Lagenidium giganteum TaxID=4803 RepID=A0AAV2ZC22_9STRA|nr:TPA: hypothetical protein N0F65_006995 [Lagenidium giganteum]